MNTKGSAILLVIGLAVPLAGAGSLWETDFEAASTKARAENRFLLLDFTGSDWCGWCIKLDKEVFSKSEFKTYAEANLVCVELDFPRGKKLSKDLAAQNRELQQKYKVGGYPTIILLDPDGATVARTGYKEGGAESYVEHLEALIAPQRKGEVKSAVAAGAKPTATLRTWTAKSGSTIEGTLVQYGGGTVLLRKANGKQVSIRDTSLSDEDLAFLKGR